MRENTVSRQILVVAVSKWVNEREVRLVASYPPDDNVFRIDSYSLIDTIRRPLKAAVCNGTSRLVTVVTQQG